MALLKEQVSPKYMRQVLFHAVEVAVFLIETIFEEHEVRSTVQLEPGTSKVRFHIDESELIGIQGYVTVHETPLHGKVMIDQTNENKPFYGLSVMHYTYDEKTKILAYWVEDFITVWKRKEI